jgi:hypothetical protein
MLAQLFPYSKRRDDLGTSHHDEGTLRMSKEAKHGVTDILGCPKLSSNTSRSSLSAVRRASAIPVSMRFGDPTVGKTAGEAT